MNINKAQICGRLTKDPEIRKTAGGHDVVSFSLATNRTWKDSAGVKQEEVEFHNCVAWNKLAELISQYMTKGCELYVEGRLTTRTWDDKEGKKHYMTEIVVESMQFGQRPAGSAKASPDAVFAKETATRKPVGPGYNAPQEEVPVIDLDEPVAEADQIPF